MSLIPEVQLDNEYLNHLKKLVLNKKIEWIKKSFYMILSSS